MITCVSQNRKLVCSKIKGTNSEIDLLVVAVVRLLILTNNSKDFTIRKGFVSTFFLVAHNFLLDTLKFTFSDDGLCRIDHFSSQLLYSFRV